MKGVIWLRIWLRAVLLTIGWFFLYVLWEREKRERHEKWLKENRELQSRHEKLPETNLQEHATHAEVEAKLQHRKRKGNAKTRKVSFNVIVPNADGSKPYTPDGKYLWQTVTLTATGDKITWESKGIKGTENHFRHAIAHLVGLPKAVMSDLYRQLVFNNATRFEGLGGHKAKQDMDRVYPDNDLLPNWEMRTGDFNASGAIVHNLLQNDGKSEAWLIVTSLLETLLTKNILKDPQVDRNYRLDAYHNKPASN